MATPAISPALSNHLIKDVPASMFYIPDFITEAEEANILNKVIFSIPANRWIQLSHRRLQAIPARLTASNALVASTGIPEWLSNPVFERIEYYDLFKNAPHGINHCLVNEYLPGQGIMAHEDGAAYYPVVATVSLGGTIVLDVTEKAHSDSKPASDSGDEPQSTKERKAWRILQEPRSLLITTEAAYTDTLHGIADVTEDVGLDEHSVANWSLLSNPEAITAAQGRNERTTRISLTFRNVLKESRVASKIFGKPKS